MIKFKNLIEVLRLNVTQQPDNILYRYIDNSSTEPLTLTFSEVDYEARAIATKLLKVCKKGERVLMLYPSGLEFITALLGCFYAGVIAIPAYPPRKNEKTNRLKSIIKDAKPTIVLSTEKSALIGKNFFEKDVSLHRLQWFETDRNRMKPDIYTIDIKTNDIAFIQYTSGSTGNPKGVIVTHGNIMSNMECIYKAFGHSKETIGVSWLPHFHDMGLIGCILQPLYGGFVVTLMAPTYFLQKPIRWLEAISKYGANTGGGPNFAYDLCVDSINDEDLEGIDLSSWLVAINGSEPIRATTLNRFSKKFAKCGFSASSHYPCYGMAETTLMITCSSCNAPPRILSVNKKKLEQNYIDSEVDEKQAQSLVSSGVSWLDHEVIIVDMNKLEKLEENKVGEVWVRGASVAHGYWKNTQKTEEIFNAYLCDTNEGPYLRTGDLGALNAGELFICGRAKDLLIIRGRNFYPQDIEFFVSKLDKAFIYNGCAAFSVVENNQEQLVIIQEIKRTYFRKINIQESLAMIKINISKELGLQVYDIVLIRQGHLLKTSSGKVQRQGNKKAYLQGDYNLLASLKGDISTQKSEKIITFNIIAYKNLNKDESKVYLTQCIEQVIADILEIPVSQIKREKNLLALGMDSLSISRLLAQLNDTYNFEVSFETIFKINSITALVELVQKQLNLKKDGILTESTSIKKIPSSQYVDNKNLNEIEI